MISPQGITAEGLTTETLRTADENMTAFLKERFAENRSLIIYEKEMAPATHHIDVKFYIDGNVKINTIKNGKSAYGHDHICGVFLTPDRDVDEWVNYAIENRVYRL